MVFGENFSARATNWEIRGFYATLKIDDSVGVIKSKSSLFAGVNNVIRLREGHRRTFGVCLGKS